MSEPEVITEIDQLRRHVAALWPKYTFTPEQAGNRLARWRRHGLLTICDALTAWESEHPDDRGPSWKAIGVQLARRASRQVTMRGDGANYYRSWFGHVSEDSKPPPYAQELLEADKEHVLDLAHWQTWFAAAQTIGQLTFYHWRLRAGWPSNPVNRAGRVELLRKAHFQVRNLTTFGSRTEERKKAWLAQLNMDALAGGERLDETLDSHGQPYPEDAPKAEDLPF